MTTQPVPAVTRQSLLETLQAFKRTSLLRAALDLGVFDALAGGPRDAAELARVLGVDARALRVFLGAAAATGLLAVRDGAFALPSGAEDLLVSGRPGFAGHAVRINVSDWEWEVMRDLAATVRKGGTPLSPDATEEAFGYWEEFAAQGTFVTRAAAAAVVEETRAWAAERGPLRVLDAGCGHALFGLEVLRAHPGATLTGLDRPGVLAQARGHAERAGLTDRTSWIEGDLFSTPLGGPYDLVVVANMLPMFGPGPGTALLRRLAGVLAPGGRLVTAGFSVDGGAPADEHAAHMLSLLMLVSTPGGEAYSLADTRRMLSDAGLVETGARRVDRLPVQVVAAEIRPTS
ncbi:Ubiquinone/menaquinone biosynthesis C-methylase UbiE [Actinacidiphila yanglinensis]|uniref:Ubiquinone/menaquinone biosynthesis C-methylase UbiE n=1 Tax=Actinacidiphila yanglinensis TaxID=310779 RepID=A0A1H6E7A6_9ACTN|nr:class I SAM-dependent methyltransferase [Actinacidiphila yanglinensis]SEG93547.1 Ubiquinone/menaquinone biosynthesis C-methylase UbiE [Actinacidiphila yanglinensis]